MLRSLTRQTLLALFFVFLKHVLLTHKATRVNYALSSSAFCFLFFYVSFYVCARAVLLSSQKTPAPVAPEAFIVAVYAFYRMRDECGFFFFDDNVLRKSGFEMSCTDQ